METYELSNCRWATKKEQANNRKSNSRLKMYGTVMTMAEWFDALSIPPSTVYHRLRRGMSPEEAFGI